MERWIPLRNRDKYQDLKKYINLALDVYWDTQSKTPPPAIDCINACKQITLKSYRLLMYIRKEIDGVGHYINNEIKETGDAAVAFYCLGDGKTSYQEEFDILEDLSRAAYQEMKKLKKQEEDEELGRVFPRY